MQATGSGSGPSLDYGPDYGRLSRPEGLPDPTGKIVNADIEPRGPRSEQQIFTSTTIYQLFNTRKIRPVTARRAALIASETT